MSSIPVLAVGPVLLVSIQVDLNNRVASELQNAILSRIEATGSLGLLIDITAVTVVDSYIARVLTETARMAKIMNTRVVLVGVQPEVAITLLDMGLELSGIDAATDIERGLETLGYRLSTVERRRGADRRDGYRGEVDDERSADHDD